MELRGQVRSQMEFGNEGRGEVFDGINGITEFTKLRVGHSDLGEESVFHAPNAASNASEELILRQAQDDGWVNIEFSSYDITTSSTLPSLTLPAWTWAGRRGWL